jgi:hypothetical protein
VAITDDDASLEQVLQNAREVVNPSPDKPPTSK